MNPPKKRIAIDARFLGEAGPGRYVKNIISQLENLGSEYDYVIYLTKKGFDQYQPSRPNIKKVLADYKWYSWKEQTGFLLRILKDRPDIFYVPHFNIPVLYMGKLVTAIPDIIMHSFSTERGTTLPKPYFKFKKLIYKLVVRVAVLRSYKVIVPSNDVKNDFINAYPGVPQNKFVVAYEGVDSSFAGDDPKIFNEFNITGPFLLYVSSMYEHKNVPFLLNAFSEFAKTHSEYKLVLVGKKDKYSEKVFADIKAKGLSDKIILPGLTRYITDGEITSLRKRASAYVFPSLKEGFSLTPLEAQSAGLPSLISDIPCHNEIYGDSVLYFDPHNQTDFLQKLDLILFDGAVREKLISLGYENVKKYDWKKTAEITLGVFSDLLNNR